MVAFNKIIIAGNLTNNPELKYTSGGTPVCKFAIAINSYWRNQAGEKQQEATFIPVEVWKKTAESCAEHLQKGKSVLIEGRVKQDKWTDKDGQNHSRLYVVGSIIRFLSQKPKDPEGNQPINEEDQEFPQ